MAKVEKQTITKVFLRSLMYGASWNYERMQNLGFLYTLLPVLKKVYKDDKEGMKTAMTRHMEFFNTHQTAAPFILGVTSALEDQEQNKGAQSIRGLKVGLMGPLAGLGDSLISLTFVPIIFSIGASYSKEGNPLGIFLALSLINAINLPLKYYGLKYGFNKGSEFIARPETKANLEKITQMSMAIGLMLIGGLIPAWVGLKFGFSYTQGDLVVSLQEMIDKVIPGVMPLLLTLGIYQLIKKGKNPVLIIFALMAIAILLVWLGVLA